MGVKVRERTMGALVIFLACLISTVAFADESYLCIGEHATGFGYDNTNKSWSAARFKVNNMDSKEKHQSTIQMDSL